MPTNWFTLISVLCGAAAGGLINYFSASRSKEKEWHLAILRERILERQKLYAQFLASSQKLLAQAMDEKFSNVAAMSVIYDELARIELVSSQRVIESAVSICSHVLNAHAQNPPKTETDFFSLKKVFISAVRDEITSLELPNNSSKRTREKSRAA